MKNIMKKIGIIAAMKEEMQEIKNIMINIEEINLYELVFFEGQITGNDVILVEAGVGKVNAARVTQILIDKFDVKTIINVGSAGAANNELRIGDIVIGKKIVQHDFDITAFGHPKGYISNVGLEIQSTPELVNKIEKIANMVNFDDIKIKIGTIASGDIFCTEIKMKEKIRKKFEADAIEMEGAAIAQVCKLCDIPFIIIRGISDTPDGNNNVTFEQYLEKASKMCANILQKFMQEI